MRKNASLTPERSRLEAQRMLEDAREEAARIRNETEAEVLGLARDLDSSSIFVSHASVSFRACCSVGVAVCNALSIRAAMYALKHHVVAYALVLCAARPGT